MVPDAVGAAEVVVVVVEDTAGPDTQYWKPRSRLSPVDRSISKRIVQRAIDSTVGVDTSVPREELSEADPKLIVNRATEVAGA